MFSTELLEVVVTVPGPLSTLQVTVPPEPVVALSGTEVIFPYVTAEGKVEERLIVCVAVPVMVTVPLTKLVKS
jgi:hypothetical protein